MKVKNIKIKENGSFSPFPGIAVLSFPQNNFEEIYKLVAFCYDIKKYYRPVTSNAYHVTFRGLFTEKTTPGEWSSFVFQNSRNWIALSGLIDNYFYKNELRFIIKDISFDYKLRLKIEFDPESKKKIELFISEVETLVGKLISLPLHEKKKNDEDFFITIGYRYKIPQKGAITEEIKKFKKQIRTLVFGQIYTLLNPCLCSFGDVTKFDPINGDPRPRKESIF